ncbi:MAG: hypothetical protein HYY64_19305 [Candidatus Rokubacteria bacterium]|nr:hypothetical protein [Candidatus Rokubacteria bacterium]
MNWLSLLNTIAKYGLVLYLVSHGLSLPAGSKGELEELAAAFYWSAISWASALIERSWQL